MFKDIIKELRPKSWLKNVFVFIPLVFALSLTDLNRFLMTVGAFFCFCFASSAVYIFNDIKDKEIDKTHPVKCRRPIADGRISVKTAVLIICVLLAISVIPAFFINPFAGLMILFYIILNLLYTLIFKHKPILDAFCIAAGFILRIYAGSFASGDPVSDWLFLTIVAMCLFMAFGKRRGEMANVEEADRRAVLEHYNIDFLREMVYCTAGLSVVFYALWAMSKGMGLIFTVPIIIFIIAKYLLISQNDDSHGDPTDIIFGSKTLIIACILYAILTVALLYTGSAAVPINFAG
jgi:4-hydroxybenzoate polyprenyltransferase